MLYKTEGVAIWHEHKAEWICKYTLVTLKETTVNEKGVVLFECDGGFMVCENCKIRRREK